MDDSVNRVVRAKGEERSAGRTLFGCDDRALGTQRVKAGSHTVCVQPEVPIHERAT
jgi:hypothetical protein